MTEALLVILAIIGTCTVAWFAIEMALGVLYAIGEKRRRK